jgi:hypothetical protein
MELDPSQYSEADRRAVDPPVQVVLEYAFERGMAGAPGGTT